MMVQALRLLLVGFVFVGFSSQSVQAAAVDLNMVGTFNKVEPIYFRYPNKFECKSDGGQWKDGLCFFNGGGPSIVIKKSGDKFDLVIESVGNNGHMCEFTGTAVVQNQVHLNSTDGVSCQLSVLFTDPNTLSLVNNGECADYCGALVELSFDGVKRVK
jgi:hypothetical protein